MSLFGRRTRLTEFAAGDGSAARLPPTTLARVLAAVPRPAPDPNLLVGTHTHDDAGVYRLTADLALVQTADALPPMLDDPYTFGRVAAADALSDVYAMGGRPLTALNLVHYPADELGLGPLADILRGGAERCEAAGCTVVGGHTVPADDVSFGLAVTGTVEPRRVRTNAGAKPGDLLVLTKPLGTGFVTAAARRGKCPPDLFESAVRCMVELNRAAGHAAVLVGVNALTDVSGGGLAGHAHAMAAASGCTFVLHLSALPLLVPPGALDVTRHRTRANDRNREATASATAFDGAADEYRREFLYDAQTSGGLLASVPAVKALPLLAKLKELGTPAAAVVGEVIDRRNGLGLIVKG